MKTTIDQLERNMERRWLELARAEQRDVSVAELERMYERYLKALNMYMRAVSKERVAA